MGRWWVFHLWESLRTVRKASCIADDLLKLGNNFPKSPVAPYSQTGCYILPPFCVNGIYVLANAWECEKMTGLRLAEILYI